MTAARMFVLGLDGACENTVGALYSQGRLPNMRALLNARGLQPLKSTPLPITPAAWTSMYSGRLPGKTGVLTFERPASGYSTRIVNSRDVTDSIYDILPSSGKTLISVGFPMTSPPPATDNAIVVSGWDALPSAPLCNNEKWRSRLAHYGYVLKDEFTADESTHRGAIDARFALLSAMLEEEPWDCAMLYLGFIDSLGHRLGGGNVQTLRLLEIVDRNLGVLADRLGDCAFAVCSDHGFARFGRSFSLLQWLSSHGYLDLASADFPNAHGLGGAEVGAIDLNGGSINWQNTRAFAYEAVGSYGGIRLNLKGNYPNGTVAPRDAWSLAGEIAEQLAAARDPQTNESIVERVWRREELFWGPHVPEFPELIVEAKADTVVFVGKRVRLDDGYRLEEGFVHRGAFDSHTPYGIWGSSFETARISGVEDVGPTICAMLDVPMTGDLDGRSAWTHEARGRREEREIPTAQGPSAYTSEEEEVIRKRLEDLGYL